MGLSSTDWMSESGRSPSQPILSSQGCTCQQRSIIRFFSSEQLLRGQSVVCLEQKHISTFLPNKQLINESSSTPADTLIYTPTDSMIWSWRQMAFICMMRLLRFQQKLTHRSLEDMCLASLKDSLCLQTQRVSSKYLSTQQVIKSPSKAIRGPMGRIGPTKATRCIVLRMLAYRRAMSTGWPQKAALSSRCECDRMERRMSIRLSSLKPQTRSKQLKRLAMQELVIKRKKQSLASWTILVVFYYLIAKQELTRNVVPTMFMKNTAESLDPTVRKQLLYDWCCSYAVTTLMQIPSKEFIKAIAPATSKLRKKLRKGEREGQI